MTPMFAATKRAGTAGALQSRGKPRTCSYYRRAPYNTYRQKRCIPRKKKKDERGLPAEATKNNKFLAFIFFSVIIFINAMNLQLERWNVMEAHPQCLNQLKHVA